MRCDKGTPGTPRRSPATLALIALPVTLAVGLLAATQGLWRPSVEPDATRLTDVVSKAIETEGIDAAVARYRSLRKQGFPRLRESEADTNRLGYALLRKREPGSAIQVLRLNVETHPRSANVYDSLGEAYLAAGHKAEAIESYERAVAIDPRMKTAIGALQDLTNRPRKPYRPMLLFHICAGSLALLSGALAICLSKGSRRHAVAGNVFVVCMLSMSGSGAYMAFVAPDGEVVNVLMGVLTFYLVATAWLTARRRTGGTGLFDCGALLIALAVGAGLAKLGLEAMNAGRSAGQYFVFGAVALLAAASDLRMILRGGVFGGQRVARHLWRMCSGFFIAVTSLFLGQPQVFPAALRNSGLLVVPSVLVVGLMVFWLIRVLLTNAHKRPGLGHARDGAWARGGLRITQGRVAP
jgi:uncharacterized membrane protein